MATKLDAVSHKDHLLENVAGYDMNHYHRESQEFAVYAHRGSNLTYPIMGLCGEAGELANKWKKVLRVERQPSYLDLMAIEDELGDVLWYCAAVADELGLTLSKVAKTNLDKLQVRYNRRQSPPPNFSIGTSAGDTETTRCTGSCGVCNGEHGEDLLKPAEPFACHLGELMEMDSIKQGKTEVSFEIPG